MEATFRKHKRSLFFKQRLMGYVFLLPTAVLFLIFTVVPFIMAFYLSFFEYNLLEVGEFVGFEYYSTAFSNTEFMKSFLNILIYAVMYVPFIIIISLLAAVLGNSELFGAKAMRIIFYLPCITGSIATAYVWRWMFDVDSGVFNGIISLQTPYDGIIQQVKRVKGSYIALISAGFRPSPPVCLIVVKNYSTVFVICKSKFSFLVLL